MHPHKHLWTAYLIGAILTLVYKWAKYCYEGNKLKKSMKDCTLEWFFEASLSNGISWVTTIGIVWTFGVAYIDHVVWLFGDYIKSIPLEPSIAFLLGSIMELLAPAVVKWIMSKIPFGSFSN